MKDAAPTRFVPILTEVVQDVPPPQGPMDAEREAQVLARVRARVLAELEPVIVETLRAVQEQQAQALQEQVRAALTAEVARLVDEALLQPPQA